MITVVELLAFLGLLVIFFALWASVGLIWEWLVIEYLRFTRAWGYMFYAVYYHKEFKEYVKERKIKLKMEK